MEDVVDRSDYNSFAASVGAPPLGDDSRNCTAVGPDLGGAAWVLVDKELLAPFALRFSGVSGEHLLASFGGARSVRSHRRVAICRRFV